MSVPIGPAARSWSSSSSPRRRGWSPAGPGSTLTSARLARRRPARHFPGRTAQPASADHFSLLRPGAPCVDATPDRRPTHAGPPPSRRGPASFCGAFALSTSARPRRNAGSCPARPGRCRRTRGTRRSPAWRSAAEVAGCRGPHGGEHRHADGSWLGLPALRVGAPSRQGDAVARGWYRQVSPDPLGFAVKPRVPKGLWGDEAPGGLVVVRWARGGGSARPSARPRWANSVTSTWRLLPSPE
jgi:hypothetical protein